MDTIAGDLNRFVEAQAPVYDEVCMELAAGAKRTHWMWFVFPQLEGLGRSPTARFFGLRGRAEALAYWRHALLGPRLRHCTETVLAARGRTLSEIFGSPDDLKFVSCMTLFEAVTSEEVFAHAVEHCAGGRRDARTLALLD